MIKVTTTKSATDSVKILIYGKSGVGKTRLCATAPKPIIVSSEKKNISLRKFDIPVILVSSVSDLDDAFEVIKTKKEYQEYQTICIDSISDIAEMMLEEFSQPDENGKKPHGMQVYGNLGREGLAFTKKFRDLENRHIYMIAKMERQDDEITGEVSSVPSMPGRVLTTSIPYQFDYVFPLLIGESEIGKYRYFQTEASPQYTAKGDSEVLEEMEEAHLGKLFKKIMDNRGE